MKENKNFVFVILFFILLSTSVMGGVGFDFKIGKVLISLHSMQNILIASIIIWLIKKACFMEKLGKKDIDIPIFVYIFVYILSVIFSSYPKVSLLFFLNTALAVLFCYLLIDNIKDKNKLEAILFILLISVLYTVSHSIIRYWGNKVTDNYYSFPGNAEFGAIVVLSIPILISFFVNYRTNIAASIFFIFGLIILATGLIISYSRGSWIGFVIVFFSFVLIHKRLLKNWRVLFLKILVIIFLFLVLPYSVKNRINSLTDFTNTTGDRIQIWKSSLKMIRDFPFFGAGPGTYDNVVLQYKGSEAKEDWVRGWHAHNIFLHIASENGVIGLIAFSTLIIFSFKKYFELKNKMEDEMLKNLLDGAILSLVGYLACSQTTIFFANHNKNEKISMFLWFDIALIFIIENITNIQEENKRLTAN